MPSAAVPGGIACHISSPPSLKSVLPPAMDSECVLRARNLRRSPLQSYSCLDRRDISPSLSRCFRSVSTHILLRLPSLRMLARSTYRVALSVSPIFSHPAQAEPVASSRRGSRRDFLLNDFFTLASLVFLNGGWPLDSIETAKTSPHPAYAGFAEQVGQLISLAYDFSRFL